MDDIFVVQVCADGAAGFPRDRVVDVGIVRVDAERLDAESYYNNRIALPEGSFMKKQKAFMLENSGLTPEDLQSGRPQDEVVHDVKHLLRDRVVTSYDVGNTFMRFLLMDPWDLTHEVSIMSSIGSGLPPSLRGRRDRDENTMICLAYDALFPDDEKAIGDGRTALDLALKSACILIEELRTSGQ